MRGGGSLRAWALAGLAGLTGLVVLSWWVPSDDPRTSICLFRHLFGLPCPSCGLTRALAHLAKGEWPAALAAHPLAPLLAAELGLLWAAWGVSLARGSRPRFAYPDRVAGSAESTRAGTWTVPGEWVELLLIGNLAAFIALWLGRLATGTLPW